MENKEVDKLKTKFLNYTNEVLEGGYIIPNRHEKAFKSLLNAFSENKLGVLMYGNPGSGKTFPFEVMLRLIHPQSPRKFIKKNALEIVVDFNENGHSVLNKYNKTSVLYDDLGTEGKGKFYGDTIETFEKIIQFRYDLFREKGFKTHFTTNLSLKQIESRYGARCYSRLFEMVEIIPWGMDKDYSDNRKLRNFKGFPPIQHPKIMSKEDKEYFEAYEKLKKHNQEMNKSTSGKGLGQRFKEQLGFTNE